VVKPPARAPEHSLRPPPPVTTPFRYLNAGSFIGYAGAIRRLIQALSPRETDDDQALFTRHFLQNPGSMKLDYGATLFQTLCGLAANDLVIEKGKPLTLRNRLLGTEPCLLHGNGPGRTVFFALLACMRALGWP
jgi:hypothetical protein